MKFQDQLTGIESAFRGFKRINHILSENWTDSNMAAFNANHIVPITSNGIKSIQEAQTHFSSIDKTIAKLSQDRYALDQAINQSKDCFDSSIDGCIICHCYVHNRVGDSEMRGFLIPQGQANYANDKNLQYSLACSKLPEYDDYSQFYVAEMINLR